MEKFEIFELKFLGIMGWFIGQKYGFFNGEELVIIVSFDYDCFVNNFNYKICFFNVRVCVKEIIFFSVYMSMYEEFCYVFMIVYCKG